MAEKDDMLIIPTQKAINALKEVEELDKSWFDRVITWLKKYGGFLLGGIIATLGAGWIYQRRVTLNVRDDLKVQRVKTKVAELQSVSQRLEEMNEEDEVVIAEIESQREEIKQEIEEAHEVSGMTDEEVLSAFADLGYH
jgi:hypothetical protein